MKKLFKVLVATAVTACAMSIVSFSASWLQGADGRWWYQHDDGSYTTNNWELIDGKYYYFDAQGWMLSNTTTPDGYQVGADGAWVQNTDSAAASAASNNAAATGKRMITDGSENAASHGVPAITNGYDITPYNLLPYSFTEVFEGYRRNSYTTFTITDAETFAAANGGLGITFKYKVKTTGDTPESALMHFQLLDGRNVAAFKSGIAIFEADSVNGTVYGSKDFVVPPASLPKGSYRLRVYGD